MVDMGAMAASYIPTTSMIIRVVTTVRNH